MLSSTDEPHPDARPDEADRNDRHRDEDLELEEGALDPDELEGDPLHWDEGADDEVR